MLLEPSNKAAHRECILLVDLSAQLKLESEVTRLEITAENLDRVLMARLLLPKEDYPRLQSPLLYLMNCFARASGVLKRLEKEEQVEKSGRAATIEVYKLTMSMLKMV